jgi:hypothetical protein
VVVARPAALLPFAVAAATTILILRQEITLAFYRSFAMLYMGAPEVTHSIVGPAALSLGAQPCTEEKRVGARRPGGWQGIGAVANGEEHAPHQRWSRCGCRRSRAEASVSSMVSMPGPAAREDWCGWDGCGRGDGLGTDEDADEARRDRAVGLHPFFMWVP